MGDKGREDPRKSGHAIQQEKTRRGTMRDTGRQDPHTIQHQGGHLKKVLRTPNSTLLGEQEGRQGETRGEDPREGGHPTKGSKKGYNWRQGETKGQTRGDKGRQDPREGGHTIQQKGTTTGTMGDKTLGKVDTPSNTKADTLRKH